MNADRMQLVSELDLTGILGYAGVSGLLDANKQRVVAAFTTFLAPCNDIHSLRCSIQSPEALHAYWELIMQKRCLKSLDITILHVEDRHFAAFDLPGTLERLFIHAQGRDYSNEAGSGSLK